MNQPLDARTVLVTGAKGGLGEQFVLQALERGAAKVYAAARTPKDWDDSRVESLTLDLTDPHGAAHAAAAAPDVDLLVNNAGIGVSDLFDRTPWDRTSDLLATNVVALVRLTHALVPGMVARGRGGVLNLGSGAGLTVMPAAVAYGASKHFVHGFSATLRADLAGTGVVVTEVCPGPVESEFDAAAGNPDGLTGGPPAALTITAAECAREAVAGLDRGAAVVYPGRAYRLLMRVRPLLPGALVRRQAAKGAQQLRAAR